MDGNADEESCSHCAGGAFDSDAPSWNKAWLWTLAFSAAMLAAGLYLEFALAQELYAHALYVVVILASGQNIFRRAWAALMRKRPDMNFLMSAAAIGAFLTGHGEEGATVIFLFAGAEFLEEYAGDRARRSIAELLKLAPETANVKKKGKTQEMHVHEVKVGDILVVKPGDRIPLDGVVSKGASHVNEAPITGESVPAAKRAGSLVYAGAINGEGYLEIRATKLSGQTAISKIASIVEKAQKQKSKTERFVDRFAAVYTPAVIVFAGLVAVVPPIFLGWAWGEWFYRALVLLVTACPCALAISTPVSLVSGLSTAARNGLLVKGGDYLEEAGKAKAVILDKTGTLTKGIFEVSDVVPVNHYSEEELLKIAASLEAHSAHPVGTAIGRRWARGLHAVRNFTSITGKGVKGAINGTEYFVGNLKLPVKIDSISRKEMEKLEGAGKTAVVVASKSKVVGIIAVSDAIRPEAYGAVSELKKLGVTPIMLTGDNKETAKAIAGRLGIAHYHADMLPEQKLRELEKIKAKYGTVMMVGDGVNDAPALAAADVGIAMGAIGSDVAIETADVAIMRDDLNRLPLLVRLSRKTSLVVKENVAASVLVKGSIGALAIFGLIELWVAVAAGDMGLSLLVILNAMTLGIGRAGAHALRASAK